MTLLPSSRAFLRFSLSIISTACSTGVVNPILFENDLFGFNDLTQLIIVFAVFNPTSSSGTCSSRHSRLRSFQRASSEASRFNGLSPSGHPSSRETSPQLISSDASSNSSPPSDVPSEPSSICSWRVCAP